jgi:hypothetical protein
VDHWCKDCGEMVIEQLNNTQRARYEGWDWILYCADVECEHHEGDGYFQVLPDWVVTE